MSGHSKWAKLKHLKGKIDAKKSALFSKLSRMISVAAREGGGDPDLNFKLRLAIEKAKQANMPKENIEKAIKKGTGELSGESIEQLTYEVILPEGAAMVVEALTDNKNRTVSNLRRILHRYNADLAGKNSVLWMFEKKGIIRIVLDNEKEKEKIELKAIDAGAEDIKEEADELVIYTKPEKLQKVKEFLEKENIKIDYAEVEWFAKNPIEISSDLQKKIDGLFAELDKDPDINDYYTNIKGK